MKQSYKNKRPSFIIFIRFHLLLIFSSFQCIESLSANEMNSNSKISIQSIKVVCDNNYPPYIFMGPKGEIQGIVPSLWKIFEKKTGIKIHLLPMEWSKALQIMQEGKADVIDTIFYNEKRALIYDFSKPYAELPVPVFFHKNISGINDISSLQGFTIGVKSGDACIEILRKNGITQLKEYGSYEEIISAAAKNQIKVFSIDQPPAYYYLYKLNLEENFNQSLILYSGKFHRAVKKGNTELLLLIEKGFSQISEEEKKEINDKWLGISLAEKINYHYFLYGILAIGVLSLVLIIMNVVLRRKYLQKTSELRNSEEKYRRMFEDTSLGVFHASLDGKLLDANQAYCRLFGFKSLQEAISYLNEKISEKLYVKPELRDQYIQQIEQSAEKQIHVDGEFYRKDHSIFYARLFFRKIYDASLKQTILEGFIEDISEQKRNQIEIQELNQELENKVLERTALYETANKELMQTNLNLEKTLSELQLTQEQLILSEKMAVLGQLISGIAHEINNPLGAIYSSDENLLQNFYSFIPAFPEFAQKMDDNEKSLYQQALQVLFIQDFLVPPAEKRKTKARLIESLKLIYPENPELGAELIVETKLNLFENLYLDILKTPHAISILENLSQVAVFIQIGQIIRVSVGKANRIIAALKTYIHKDYQGQKQTLNISETIEIILVLYHNKIKQGVEIEKDFQHQSMMLGHADKLGQVWANLINNSLQAMNYKGKIQIMTRENPDAIIVSFTDNGPGIPKEIQPKIFTPFFTTKKAGEGSGLGLDICRKIIEEHGGSIGFQSEPGKTVFEVTLKKS